MLNPRTIDSERVVTVFGRAGMQSFYKREMINSLGFVIFDAETATSRVVGVSAREMVYEPG